jgi:hypothetical protein
LKAPDESPLSLTSIIGWARGIPARIDRLARAAGQWPGFLREGEAAWSNFRRASVPRERHTPE